MNVYMLYYIQSGLSCVMLYFSMLISVTNTVYISEANERLTVTDGHTEG